MSAGLHSRAMITRTTSGQAAYHSEAIVGTASASSWQQRLWNTASITWANAQNIKCHAKSSVATAGLVTLEELRVSWVPR